MTICQKCGANFEPTPENTCAYCGAYQTRPPSSFPLRIALAFVPAVLILAIPAVLLATHPNSEIEAAYAVPVALAVLTPFYELAWAFSWRKARLGPVKAEEKFERGCGTFALAAGVTAANYCVVFGGCIALLGLFAR